MRTMASSVSNRNAANDLVNSVLPTPVGPRNRNEPLGREGSESPARERRIASATALTASSCPTTRLCRASSIRNSLSRSPSSILATGIPVHLETTSAISSSLTALRNSLVSCISACAAISSCFSRSGIRPYCNSDMRVRSPARRAVSSSMRARSSASLICCVPCTAAFSEFQISSSSWYSRSRLSISTWSFCRRSLDASSLSLFRASRSIFS